VEELIYIEISAGMIFALTVLLLGFNVWLYLRRGARSDIKS
jgi:hypothetical protein